jgi:hypothetical protein
VLDIAPLIMVTLPTVSSFSFGVSWQGLDVLLHLWLLPSSRVILLANDLSPLLSSLWMASRANGSLSLCEWCRLHVLRVASSSRSRNGGLNRHRNGPGQLAWADRPRPILSRFGHPFAPVSPLDILHFASSNYIILTMSSSRPRWRVFLHEVRSFTL